MQYGRAQAFVQVYIFYLKLLKQAVRRHLSFSKIKSISYNHKIVDISDKIVVALLFNIHYSKNNKLEIRIAAEDILWV